MKRVGFSGTPNNAPNYVKKTVDQVINVKGGDGAFRAFVEEILERNNKFEFVLEKYLNKSTTFNQ